MFKLNPNTAGYLKFNHGFTLTELMISLVVGSLVSLAAVTAFSTQSALISQQTLRMQAAADGQEAHEVLSRLLRHASRSSVDCVMDTSDFRRIDFSLPFGMRIWPNTSAPNFDNNRVRLQWDKTAMRLGFTNAPTLVCADDVALTPLLGSTVGYSTRITDFNIVNNNNGSFQLRLQVQAGTIASTTTLLSNNILARNE